MKSVKVFRLFNILPSSYHARPISCPPRMCASAYTTPRSTRLRLFDENVGSVLDPYEPYEYSSIGRVPSRTNGLRYTMDTGTIFPSDARAHVRSVPYSAGSYPPSTSVRFFRSSVRALM